MRKPWATKEWRKKREEWLKNKTCEWCGTSENLVVHHKKEITSYRLHLRLVGQDFLESKIREGEFTTEAVKDSICPKCETRGIYERTTILPIWRCARCGYEFDAPEIVVYDTGRLSRSDWDVFYFKYGDEIKETVLKQRGKFHKYYVTFDDCVSLCNRCHLALHKGMHLCIKCKKKYSKYELCWDCFTKTEKGREVLKKKAELEDEEEVPLVEVILPCKSKVMVYSDQLAYGGITEVCMHQCPSSFIGEILEECVAFKQWYSKDGGKNES